MLATTICACAAGVGPRATVAEGLTVGEAGAGAVGLVVGRADDVAVASPWPPGAVKGVASGTVVADGRGTVVHVAGIGDADTDDAGGGVPVGGRGVADGGIVGVADWTMPATGPDDPTELAGGSSRARSPRTT